MDKEGICGLNLWLSVLDNKKNLQSASSTTEFDDVEYIT